MRLISVRPCIWLITNRAVDASCFPWIGEGAGWHLFSWRFLVVCQLATVRQTQRALLTLCSGRFDTAGVEIGHALARAFGIVGEYSFASRPISDPGPPVWKRKFRATRTHKGLPERERTGEKETEREFICFKMISTLNACMLQSDILSATKRGYFRLYQQWQTISEFLPY